MQEWLISTYIEHQYLVYAAILFIGFVEGPYISMLCGAILAAGHLSFWPVYIVLMVGDLIGDVVWYFLGHRYGERFIHRFGERFGITERHVERIKNVFHVRKYILLFVSKISNGLGFTIPVLFSAGMSRVPFGQYISINSLGQFIWTATLISVGFFFGNLYLKIDSIMGKISMLALLAVAIFAVTRYMKYLQKKVD